MMEHCRALIGSWGGGSAILSPRDCNPTQLETLATDICAVGGAVYFDPQFYLPHADHARLVSHAYWPRNYDSGGFWPPGPAGDQTPAQINELLASLLEYHNRLSCSHLILPGVLALTVDAGWISRQRAFIDAAPSLGLPESELIATVALSADAVRNVQQVNDVLEAGRGWQVGGIYLVCEHPDGYLVEDPIWMANVLELTAGFRLQGKKVILGYSNHQMLAAASAGANAIASGTWLNVRSFPPEKFRKQYEDEIRRKTTWYFCPQALSEYKIPTLDIAMLQGVLPEMAPLPDLMGHYADVLFRGAQPTTVQFPEGTAFRHYLHCLHSQAAAARRGRFNETRATHEQQLLEGSEDLLARLHAVGVRGQLRDFAECIEPSRAALAVLQTQRGPMLRRRWAEL
jgi:hypothetical protein